MKLSGPVSDVWEDFAVGPGRHHESHEGADCLLPELSIIGWLRFSSAFEGALLADSHPGEYEIHYIVSGELSWWVEDRTYDLRSGMILIIAPGETHGSTTGVLEPCEHYWMRLTFPDEAGGPSDIAQLGEAFAALEHRAFAVSPAVREGFAQMLAEHHQRGDYARVACRAALHGLLIAILRDYQALKPVVSAPIGIDRSIKAIHQSLEEPPSIQHLARVAGLSESAFRKQFREVVGCAPHDYITRRRVQAAQALLASGGKSITEVAMALGFSSSQYFATVFKRVTGQSPRDEAKQRE